MMLTIASDQMTEEFANAELSGLKYTSRPTWYGAKVSFEILK